MLSYWRPSGTPCRTQNNADTKAGDSWLRPGLPTRCSTKPTWRVSVSYLTTRTITLRCSFELMRDIAPNARVRLVLEAGDETGGGPPFYRRHATVPGSTVELPLAELRDGIVRRTLPFDVYEDTVTLRRLVTGGPQDVRFDVDDTGSIHGDYYYVRVKQVNEAMAWSSPVWVGGHPSR